MGENQPISNVIGRATVWFWLVHHGTVKMDLYSHIDSEPTALNWISWRVPNQIPWVIPNIAMEDRHLFLIGNTFTNGPLISFIKSEHGLKHETWNIPARDTSNHPNKLQDISATLGADNRDSPKSLDCGG